MIPDGTRRRIHVERTADPAVLRWVPHDPRLDVAAAGPRRVPEHTPLGRLAAAGSIVAVAVRAGSVFVTRDADESWTDLARRVQGALVQELDDLDRGAGHWLLEATEQGAGSAPTIAEVQAVVDRAAGSVMAGHGGAMSVGAIDDGTVHLRSDGACTGCQQSDDTIVGLISPAIRATYPEIQFVVVDAPTVAGSGSTAPSRSETRRVVLGRRRRGGHSGSCH